MSFYLVTRNNLANIDLLPSDMELRTHESMRQYFEDHDEKLASIESISNFFWSVP